MRSKAITPDPIVAEMKRLREAKGMSQYRLSAKAGITRATIINLERGHRHPTVYIISLYLQALGLKLAIVEAKQ